MPAPTPSEMVSQIDEAINAILLGGHSSYVVAGRSVTRLDIKQLKELRDHYSVLASRESNGGKMRVRRAKRSEFSR